MEHILRQEFQRALEPLRISAVLCTATKRLPLMYNLVVSITCMENLYPAHLEVFVEREPRSIPRIAFKRRHHPLLLIFADALLEEIRLALQ